MGGNEQNYIKEAFDTNWVAPLGPNVNGFENDLQFYLKEDIHVACLSSGTAAIHLALVQLGVGLNDEVLCQSMTFSASANPITYQGAKPVFIDSEPETWNMCPIHLETAIKDRIVKGNTPKAIIIVHLYGMPAKLDEHSILSFNGNKIITTSGGGAMVCNTLDKKKNTIFLATQARDQAPHYEHTHIGYNYRMSNISAGIGRGQMEVLDRHIALRREMNTFYKDLFKEFEGVEVFEEPNNTLFSNHWLSCILIKENTPFTKLDHYGSLCTCNLFLKTHHIMVLKLAKHFLKEDYVCLVALI